MKKIVTMMLSVALLLAASVYVKASTPEPKQETHSFFVASEEERAYLVKPGSLSTENIRYADAKNEIIYRFNIKNTLYVQRLELSGIIYQQLHLSVSTDGINYTTVYRFDGGTGDNGKNGLSRTNRTFDLTSFVDLTDLRTVYIRIADSYTMGGWGGAISPKEPVTLTATYIPPSREELNAAEMAADEHCVPLFGCNDDWGGGYTPDPVDPYAGYAALSIKLRGGDTLPQVVLTTPINGTGMDTLEFELYVSDEDVFLLPFSGYVELSSAGRPDAASLSWSLRTVFASIENKQSGWNHVALPLSDGMRHDGDAGDFDLSSVNFLRLYWVGMPAVSSLRVLKLDYFRLTDAQKQARAQMMTELNAVIGQIEQISEFMEQGIDESNFKTLARLTTNSRQACKQMTQKQLALISELGLLSDLSEAEETVAAYELALESAVPVADEPPEKPSIQPPDEQAEPPQEPPKSQVAVAVIVIAAVTVIGICAHRGRRASQKEEK
ncbi:MAG: hypothetical protein IIX15_01360 [Clostridia bacterium]|nr:hypothetical protein [Clostridia bacterium]